jgi:NitT/TauT family transport system permease protein
MVKSKTDSFTQTDAQPQQISSKTEAKAKRGRSSWWKQSLNGAGWWILSLGLFLGIWELVTLFGWVNTTIMPPPHKFLAEIFYQDQFLAPRVGVERTGGRFVALSAIVATLQRVFAGLSLSFIAALVVGGLAAYFKIFGKLVLPTITLLAPIAPIAWIPFAIMAFGVGDTAAIFVVFIGLFFTLTLGTVNCINNVEQLYINTGRVLGANRLQVMRHIVLPAIIPNLFVILRMNFFGAWMAVLAAEMVGVNTGLGALIMVARQMFNTKLMFLGMAIIGIVGYLLDVLLRQVQRRVLWWKTDANI